MSVNQDITGLVIIWTQVQLRIFGINKPFVLKTRRTWTNSAKKSGKNPKQCKFTGAVISEGVFFFKMKSQSNSSASWIKHAGFCCGFCQNMSVQQNMQDISRVARISNFPHFELPLISLQIIFAPHPLGLCTKDTWCFSWLDLWEQIPQSKRKEELRCPLVVVTYIVARIHPSF